MVSRSDVVTGIKVISKFKCLMDTYVIFLYAVIVTATPRIYNQLCSFDNFLQLTANVWTLLRLTDMWGKKLFSIFFICLWTFNDLSWIYMDQLKTAEIGTSVMRQDTYQVLTSYINNEKRNCQKIVLRKPFFFLRLCFQRLFWMFSDWTLTHWEISEILFTAH